MNSQRKELARNYFAFVNNIILTFNHFFVDVKDIRGIGLQVSRLENADTAKQGFFIALYCHLSHVYFIYLFTSYSSVFLD